MKRNVILIVLAFLLLSVAYTASAQTTLTIWINGGDNQATALVNASAAFTQETGIKVTAQAVSWDNAVAQYLTAINSGSGADIYVGGESYGVDLGGVGGLIDLKAAYPNDIQALLSGTSPDMVKAIVGADGKVYALPFNEDMLLMYYLPDKLKAAGISAAPTTWDELTAAVKALTAASDGGLGVGWGGASWLTFQPFLAQAGGSWYSADCSKSAINSDAAMTALQYYTSLYSDLGVAHDAADPSGLDNGSISILLDGEWQSAGIDATYPDLKGKWAVAPLPVGPAGNNDSFVGGSSIGIFSYSKNAADAFKYLQWLQTGEAMKALVDQNASFSTLLVPPQAANVQYIQGDPGVTDTISAQAPHLTPPPNCAGWEQAGSDINNELQNVLFNNGDYQDGLSAMETTLNTDLQTYANATLEAPTTAAPAAAATAAATASS